MSCGRVREVPRGFGIEFGERVAGSHRVHEVIRRIDALECGIQRIGLQCVAAAQFDALPAASLEHLDIPGRRAQRSALGYQQTHEVGADIAACADDEILFHGLGK